MTGQVPGPHAGAQDAAVQRLDHRAPVVPGLEAEADPAYAGLVTRTIAIVIDLIVIDATALVVTGVVLLIESVFGQVGNHKWLAAIGGVVFFFWVAGYFMAFWMATGQTPGNRVMQIRVIRQDGTRVKPRHALVRLGAMVISLPLFWGYLPILTTARRRGFPDVTAGTVVVSDRSAPTLLGARVAGKLK